MLTLSKPQFVTNENGEKVSVILPISEYEQIIQELEELEDVKLYDESKKDTEPSISLDEYVRQRGLK